MKVLAFIFLPVLVASIFSIRDPAVLKRYSAGGGGGTPLMDTNGLVAWYEFDGDLTDEHTAARDLTAGGSPFYTNDTWSASSKALRTIASGGGYAYRANESAYEAQQFSFAIWVRWPTGSDSYTMAIHAGTGSGQRSWYWRRQAGTSDRINPQTVDSANNVSTVNGANGALLDNTWYHIVGILSANTNLSIWVDGVEHLRSTTISTNIADSTGRFLIGALTDGATTYDCEISQVSYWGRLLSTNSPNEVSILYNSGNELTYQALLGN